MQTIKIYYVHTYEAWMAREIGYQFWLHEPVNSREYKHEYIEMSVDLPDGYRLGENKAGTPCIYKGDEPIDFYTDGHSLVLVSLTHPHKIRLQPYGSNFEFK